MTQCQRCGANNSEELDGHVCVIFEGQRFDGKPTRLPNPVVGGDKQAPLGARLADLLRQGKAGWVQNPGWHDVVQAMCEASVKLTDADTMAAIIDDMIYAGRLDSRSQLGDARLDYGKPFTDPDVRRRIVGASAAAVEFERMRRGFLVAMTGAFASGWFDGSPEKERIADFLQKHMPTGSITIEQAIRNAMEAANG